MFTDMQPYGDAELRSIAAANALNAGLVEPLAVSSPNQSWSLCGSNPLSCQV